ncbi:hypothetical protein QIA31_05545 (plasmid) [Borreliella turdi]
MFAKKIKHYSIKLDTIYNEFTAVYNAIITY